tara:strand:+ start:523 stop:693 length:171 start_codon:yes stop_codon:yes gene_type:complete
VAIPFVFEILNLGFDIWWEILWQDGKLRDSSRLNQKKIEVKVVATSKPNRVDRIII